MLIRGGTVVSSSGERKSDVLVRDGRIAMVEPVIEVADSEVIDASDLLVLPGLVDPHTHFSLNTGKARTIDDFESGTLSALSGGVTTYIDFATQHPGQTFQQALEKRLEEAIGHSHLDFGIHLNITHLPGGWERDLDRLVDGGVSSAKVYTTYKDTVFFVDDWTWYQLMERSGEAGLLVQVHAENDAIVEGKKRQLLAAGKTSFAYHAAARPAVAEAEAVSRGLFFSRVTGSPIYFVHLSNPLSVDLIEESREHGISAIAETCPHFLTLDDTVYTHSDAARYVMTPPLRDRSMREDLWHRVEAGLVHTIGSDHCGYSLAQRAGVDNFSQVSPGIPGVETSLLLIHSFGVVTGRLTRASMVKLLCSHPAQVFGLWPKKGDVAVGFDADLVLFDPRPTRQLTDSELHSRAGFSPYEGLEVTGKVIMTIGRGRILFDRGRILSTPGRGLYLPRQPFQPNLDLV